MENMNVHVLHGYHIEPSSSSRINMHTPSHPTHLLRTYKKNTYLFMQPIAQRHNTTRIRPQTQQPPRLPTRPTRDFSSFQERDTISFSVELLMVREEIRSSATDNTAT
jgi:hypothetical protein